MIKSMVVDYTDVLYHLPPPWSLSYANIKDYAIEVPLPNKYDSYLREVAQTLKAYIVERAVGPLTECTDNTYAAMGYYLLTDGVHGLKLADIKALDIAGERITKANKAVEANNKKVSFLTDGRLHRTDGPAQIYYIYNPSVQNKIPINTSYLIKSYYIGGLLHREDGPARMTYYDGKLTNEVYAINGLTHRTNGPAVITYDRGKVMIEEYWVNGMKHRTDGPAVITRGLYSDIMEVEYWVDGISK